MDLYFFSFKLCKGAKRKMKTKSKTGEFMVGLYITIIGVSLFVLTIYFNMVLDMGVGNILVSVYLALVLIYALWGSIGGIAIMVIAVKEQKVK